MLFHSRSKFRTFQQGLKFLLFFFFTRQQVPEMCIMKEKQGPYGVCVCEVGMGEAMHLINC